MTRWPTLAICALLALGAAACGSEDEGGGGGGGGESNLSGTIRIDGSSTVAPLSEAAAELYQGENPNVRVTVGTSGTSGGFEKFCRGETEISDASRPIKDEEIALCKKNGVKYEEVQVANDALGAVVSPQNPLKCMTVKQLNQVWDKGSKVDSWGDIDGLKAELPDEKLTLFGAGSDSGTYDYWTEAINGEEGVIRTDYNSIGEDDNAAVNGVAGEKWAMAFIPFSFVQQASEQVRALEVENPDTKKCVAATAQNVQNGSYKPLGRPLFIYPSDKALKKPEVVDFVKFYIKNQQQITEQANYIAMTPEQVGESQKEVDQLAAPGS
jgi:phosphate transport system substrate-binding protein